MKAANHRKRHIPPGPCGVWFQAQQQLSKQNGNDSLHLPGTGAYGAGRKSQHSSSMQAPSNSQDDPPQRNIGMEDISFSPAWTAAQQELNIVTPYLPPTISIPADRHRQLRPHTPSEYALLFEILRGDHDCLEASISKTILAMVANVESHIHHNIWTVELKDETNSIKAWMEPTLVQQQLRQPNTIIRPGVVWKLDRVGMIFTRQEESIERMLLIRGAAIQQVWTPEQTLHREEDTPEQQRAFLEWLENRKALPLVGMEDDENDEQDSPEEDMADYPDTGHPSGTSVVPAPRRLGDEEEDRFEPRRLSGVLGRQLGTAMNSEPWSQSLLPSEQGNLERTSASEQSTYIPTSHETNTLTIPESTTYTQEGMPSTASVDLGTQPAIHNEQQNRRLIPEPHPTTHADSSPVQKTQDPLSQKMTRSLKKSRRPETIATAWKDAAQDSACWNSLLDENDDDDSENEHEIPSTLIPSQPPEATLQKEELLSVSSELVNPCIDGEEAKKDSGFTGVPTCDLESDTVSMFQISNVGLMDLGAFDDDDDDDDDDDE